MILSGPGALSGDVARMASAISFSVIGGIWICLWYCAACISVRSASGGAGKKASWNRSALSLGSVIFCRVSGCRSAGVTLGAWFPLVLA
jgi:hypothetical protein